MQKKFTSHLETKKYQSKYRAHFITITKDIEEAIKTSKVSRGTLTVQTHHTTCGVWINENEKNLIGPSEELGYTADLLKIMDGFADPSKTYGHNDIRDTKNTEGKRDTHLCEPDENGVIQECMNGFSHAQALLIKPSLSMIIEDNKLLKGRWQEVMLVELDHDRERTVSFLIQGVKKE